MVKLFLMTLLLHTPIIVALGGIGFFLTRWSLRRQVFRNYTRGVLLVCALVFAAGMLYGVLRFGGFIIFADDNFISYHWFDSSYRDDGFRYIYSCGAIDTGVVMALLLGRRKNCPA